MNDTRQPIVTSIDGGDAISPFGLDMRVLIGSNQTGGTFSAIVASHEPGKGPGNHRHAHQDEYFLIIDGQYEVVINDGPPQVYGAGTLLYLPAGNVHGFRNVGTGTARVLDWSVPGGQDNYFREISDLQAGASFTGNVLDEVNARHQTEYLP